MRIWLRNPLSILAENAGGGLVIDGSRVTECVPAGGTPAAPVDEMQDLSRHVVLPGLVNTHHHMYQTLTRAYPAAINRELFGWLTALYPIWARVVTPDAFRLATRLALTELLLSGCTTAADHQYLFPKGLEDALDIQADEATTLGLRMTLMRGSMDLSVKDGGLPPESVVQDEDTILADSERVIGRYHDAAPGAMLQVALAPCSPFSVTRSLMTQTAVLATRCNCRLHTHLGETRDENAFCQARFDCRPVEYLEAAGWMTERTWLAHGIHFEPDEIARLGAAGVGVCHCASSNMLLASGACRTRDLEQAGAPLGLGVDGSASNDCSNLMEEVRQALLLNRLTYGMSVTHLDALRWATQGSARCLGRDDIGVLAPGKQADLACFTLDELRFSGAGDPLAALVLCGAHRADRVMVAGQWRVIDGQPLGVDVERLRREHGQAARRALATL